LGCGELAWRRQGGAVHGRDAVRPRHQVGADLDSAVTGDVVVPRDGDGDHHGMGGPADVLVTEAAERTSWMPVPGWNGENHLICRSLGTQAMTANAEGRHLAALEPAQQACEHSVAEGSCPRVE
jgi:hypothetical protein